MCLLIQQVLNENLNINTKLTLRRTYQKDDFQMPKIVFQSSISSIDFVFQRQQVSDLPTKWAQVHKKSKNYLYIKLQDQKVLFRNSVFGFLEPGPTYHTVLPDLFDISIYVIFAFFKFKNILEVIDYYSMLHINTQFVKYRPQEPIKPGTTKLWWYSMLFSRRYQGS
jgi:hypothetical protein